MRDGRLGELEASGCFDLAQLTACEEGPNLVPVAIDGSRPSQACPLFLGPGHTGANPFRDQGALKLGERGQQVEDELALWRGRICPRFGV